MKITIGTELGHKQFKRKVASLQNRTKAHAVHIIHWTIK